MDDFNGVVGKENDLRKRINELRRISHIRKTVESDSKMSDRLSKFGDKLLIKILGDGKVKKKQDNSIDFDSIVSDKKKEINDLLDSMKLV